MVVFCLFQYFEETEYQTESKRNETFGNVIFSPNVIQETWTLLQEVSAEVMRVEGAPPGRAPLPRGAPVAPPTYSFHPYIPSYPKTSRTEDRSGVPPPQASRTTKNQSGPLSSTLPKGGSITSGHLHHPGALHDEEGVVHPRG